MCYQFKDQRDRDVWNSNRISVDDYPAGCTVCSHLPAPHLLITLSSSSSSVCHSSVPPPIPFLPSVL
jgi:hypothetical protein